MADSRFLMNACLQGGDDFLEYKTDDVFCSEGMKEGMKLFLAMIKNSAKKIENFAGFKAAESQKNSAKIKKNAAAFWRKILKRILTSKEFHLIGAEPALFEIIIKGLFDYIHSDNITLLTKAKKEIDKIMDKAEKDYQKLHNSRIKSF
jgi:hypothetical protein